MGFPGGTNGKECTFQCRGHRDTGSISGLGRSPGGGYGNSLQYFCLNNSMGRGAWWAKVYRIAKSQTGLKLVSMHRHTDMETREVRRKEQYMH